MDKNKLDNFVKKIGNLPSLSPLISEIIDIANDAEASIEKLTDAIGKDQSFAAKILRVANSAYFGYSREISTLSQAVVLLGTESIRNIALGISFFTMGGQSSERIIKPLSSIFEFSVRVASCACQIARQVSGVHHDEVFISALLNDLGTVIVLKYMTDDYYKIQERSEDDKINLMDIEREILGITTSEIGEYLANCWKFPEKITNVILYKDTPYELTDEIEHDSEQIKMIKIVSLAKKACGLHFGVDQDTQLYHNLLSDLGVSERMVSDLISSGRSPSDFDTIIGS